MITYRIDLQTNPATNASQSCSGEIAYRLVAVAPPGTTGTRVGVYLDGQMIACSESTSDPRVGCVRLSKYDDQSPDASTNGSISTVSPQWILHGTGGFKGASRT